MLSSPSNESASRTEAFEYPPAANAGAGIKPSSSGGGDSTLERLWAPDARLSSGAPSQVTEEQMRAREAIARKEGRDEGLAQSAEDYAKKVALERQALVQAVGDFVRERDNYFHQVEAEVVGLALAIAGKILHREAQVDPLLLAGVVRVGIDKVAAGTHVRLHVHPDQIRAWQDFFSTQADVKVLPELMGDATLGLGHCMLETELGSTDLTLETQLKEIEQGFFDLLAQKPRG